MIPKEKSMATPFPAMMPVYPTTSVPNDPTLTARKTELLGSFVKDDYGEIVSFTPSASISLNTLANMGFEVKFNGGCALIGNKFYGMSVSTFGDTRC